MWSPRSPQIRVLHIMWVTLSERGLYFVGCVGIWDEFWSGVRRNVTGGVRGVGAEVSKRECGGNDSSSRVGGGSGGGWGVGGLSTDLSRAPVAPDVSGSCLLGI